MLKVKSTVRPRSLVIAAAIINAALELQLDVDMLITAGRDGRHKVVSKHYSDEALDFRTKHLDQVTRRALIAVLQRRLGKAYQVLLESPGLVNEHGHAEYDPT
jgi:hypothetical protein